MLLSKKNNLTVNEPVYWDSSTLLASASILATFAQVVMLPNFITTSQFTNKGLATSGSFADVSNPVK